MRWNISFDFDEVNEVEEKSECDDDGPPQQQQQHEMKWEKVNFGTLSGTLHAKLFSPSTHAGDNSKRNLSKVFTIGSLDTRVKVISTTTSWRPKF